MTIADWLCMIFRYLVCALVSVAASIFVWFFTLIPILPLLSFTTRDGNLPRWCCWLQTHDNPLDSLWLGVEGATHRLIDADSYKWLYKYTNEQIAQSFWLRFFARAGWLVRNPAYGVANALGVDKAGLIELRHVTGSDYEFWLWQTPSGRYVFKLFALRLWAFGLSLRLNIGYKAIGDEPRMMLATHINPFRKKK